MNSYQVEPEKVREWVSNGKGALLVSGSRSITNCQAWALSVVELAAKRDWFLVVGDARGVDEYVIHYANKVLHCKLIVCGCVAVGHPRQNVSDLKAYTLIPGGNVQKTCYAIRDKWMAETVALAPASGFLGLWDGQSKGTQITANHAKGLGIAGVVYNIDGTKESWKDAQS